MTQDPALAIAVPTIAEFEGFRSHPYQDQVGIWTIAYGNIYLPDGSRVTQSTSPVSQDTALLWLRTGVAKTLAAVRAMVYVPISDNAAASLTSFAWNLGTSQLRNSTLLRLLNAGETTEAANCFMAWIDAGGHPNAGLQNRRAKERALFLTPDLQTPKTTLSTTGNAQTSASFTTDSHAASTTPESEADRLMDRFNPEVSV